MSIFCKKYNKRKFDMYKEIINLTFNLVFEKKYILMKANIVHLAVLMILYYFNMKNSHAILQEPPNHLDMLLYSGNILLSYVVTVYIVITTHRILLLNDYPVPKWGLFKVTSREFSFLTTSLFLNFSIIVPVLVIGSIFELLSIFWVWTITALIIWSILFSRLSLVLPSIAIDKKISFFDAWDYTKNYKLLTYFMTIIFPTVFTVVIGSVYGLVIIILSKTISNELNILFPVLQTFIIVFITSALSATYRYIVEVHKTQKIDLIGKDTLTVVKNKSILKSNKFIIILYFVILFEILFIIEFFYFPKYNYNQFGTTGELHTIEIELENFKHEKPYKSFAAAVDIDKRYAYGYAYGYKDQNSADKMALELCNEHRIKSNIKSKCYLYGEESTLTTAHYSELIEKIK